MPHLDLHVSRPSNTKRRLRAVAGAAILTALPVLMGAEDTEGGCTLIQDTLKSPVQAVTILTETADGRVEVDLIIATTEGGESRWVTNAENAEIRTPDGDLIPLTQTSDGHYTANSDDNPALVYDASGVNYRVTFELDDPDVAGDAAGDDFIAVVMPPEDEVTFEFSKLPAFAGDTATIQWTPGSLAGLLQIRNSTGDLVYSTFNWDHPEFDGSKWGSLIHGGSEDLRVDVFADAGTYTVEFCAVASKEGLEEEVSGGLGIASGFLAGRCVDDMVIEVPE